MSIGVMLFCPFTGKPRHPSDIQSDPKGILVWDGEEPLRAYTPPAQRTWVGLTPEEKKNIFLKWYGKHWAYTKQVQAVMDSVEAKLKEKNGL